MPSEVARAEVGAGPVSRVFTGPARWLAAVVLVTGGLLQVIEFLLENPSDCSRACSAQR